MHLTDVADLMALYERLFAGLELGTTDEASSASYFAEPSEALSAAPVPLSDLLGREESVVTTCLVAFAARHAPEREALFAFLAEQLVDGDLGRNASPETDPRSLEYVYPVV